MYTPDRQINPPQFWEVEEEVKTEPCEICEADILLGNGYSVGSYDCLCKECYKEKR